MDPDVLADPANYPVPRRLAACGGITDQVQYVFEARSIDDYPRYFPAAAPLGLVTPDEPATIVVYRGTNPTTRDGPARPSLRPNEHDLCILLGPLVIVSSFLLCLVYVLWANRVFDPALRDLDR